ncbi:MAG: glycosyltransferase family 4 protein [Acidobacteriaceae bacterium]|nr:glycosyltransferase family 4 protein [Acidobacteriaceae bacterium]
MPDVLAAGAAESEAPILPAEYPRIAILMNVIAPYQKPVLDRLSQRYPGMRVFLSTPMESNRPWKLEWEGLNVVVQKTVTLNRQWKHPKGFTEPLYVHLPVDTVTQLNRFHPDIVISWEMGMRTMLAAVYRALRPGSKLIVWAEFAESTEHGRGASRQMLRKVFHHCVDAFLVTGESGARYLSSLGVVSRKIFKIAYTTDISRFAALPIAKTTETAWRLLYVGQLIERKGLTQFLDVLSRWASLYPDRAIELVLAGDGPLRGCLRACAVTPNVTLSFLGNISYQNLPEVYSRADVFVFPTLADTWGVVVNEALAGGVPVLGSLYGQAVSELVKDGKNGWTFRPDVSDEMFDALNRALCTPPAELEKMRECARTTALRLTPDYVASLIDRAINACTTRRQKAAAAL